MAPETVGVSWFAMLLGAVVLLGIFLVPLMLAIVHTSHRRRQWVHEERLRALDHGSPLPAYVPAWPIAFVCVMLGAVMPVCLFIIALVANQQFWIAPAVVAVAGVFSASILGSRWLALERGSLGPATAKPPIDADAFDVVGSRG